MRRAGLRELGEAVAAAQEEVGRSDSVIGLVVRGAPADQQFHTRCPGLRETSTTTLAPESCRNGPRGPRRVGVGVLHRFAICEPVRRNTRVIVAERQFGKHVAARDLLARLIARAARGCRRRS